MTRDVIYSLWTHFRGFLGLEPYKYLTPYHPGLITAIQRIAWHIPQWRRRGAACGIGWHWRRRRDLLDGWLREPAVMIFRAGPPLHMAGGNVDLPWFARKLDISLVYIYPNPVGLSSCFYQTCDVCGTLDANIESYGDWQKNWMALGKIRCPHVFPVTARATHARWCPPVQLVGL